MQWLSGLYYADFISFYSPTQLSHSLLSLLNRGVLSVPNVETDSASLGVPAN